MAEMIKIKYNSKWTGYKNFGDIANMSQTDMAPGSYNTFIVDGKKLEVRAGTDYLGAPSTPIVNTDPSWTLAGRIHSSYDNFVNNQGTTIPLRVYYSGLLARGDVMQVWLPVYSAGVATAVKQWYQMTPTVPAIPLVSAHRYYWAEWYDPIAKQNRLVFTYGATGTGTNYVASWTGGYANIISLTPTTLTTDTTWREKGFIDPPEGVASIVVNGLTYAITAGNFSTNTITVASTAGISVDDIAFQTLNFDTMPGTYVADVCSFIENQVYYMDWRNREVFVSWNRNQASEITTPVYQGTSGLNDASFTGPYTGTTDDTYEVTIDSVAPDVQEFTGRGMNDIFFNTSGYSGSGTNVYKVLMVADAGFTFVGTPAIIPAPGDILVGSISNAIGRVTFLDVGGQDPALVMLSPQGFQPGDVISGPQGTPYGTVFSVVGVNWFQLFKDGTAITPTAYAPAIAYQLFTGFNPVAFQDGLSFSFENTTGHSVGDFWTLTIGDHDTFSWTLNGQPQGDHIPVDTSSTSLSQGIDVTFGQLTGHALGDKWIVKVHPQIIKGWREFYYALPVRLPGQGFKITLDSNGWTMKPQEEAMYMNAAAGQYYTAAAELSSDLQSETIRVKRLKTEPQNKVLFPYLIGYIKNQLATISQDKTYDILGRQKFLELPQSKSISDDVRVDFETADWEDGDVLYFKRKIYFCVPRTGAVFVYDEFKKYWHTPMTFARRISLLAVIDNKLCGHSYESNETYELFTGTSDLGIYGIDTHMVFPYESNSQRYGEKSSGAVGFEGYIDGNPIINWKMNFGVGGCDGTPGGPIRPFFCVSKDDVSLGKSSLGFHGLGNNPVNPSQHFSYIKPFSDSTYYLRNIEVSCNSLDQRWSLISVGAEVNTSGINNASIVDNTTI